MSSLFSTTTAFSPAYPRILCTSGCFFSPTTTTWYPSFFSDSASRCAFPTKGQVRSMICSPFSLAWASTRGGTPWERIIKESPGLKGAEILNRPHARPAEALHLLGIMDERPQAIDTIAGRCIKSSINGTLHSEAKAGLIRYIYFHGYWVRNLSKIKTARIPVATVFLKSGTAWHPGPDQCSFRSNRWRRHRPPLSAERAPVCCPADPVRLSPLLCSPDRPPCPWP